MRYKTTIEILVGVAILCSMVFGAVTYFATAADVQLVAMRLDQKILADQINQIRQMMFALEDRNGGSDEAKWYNDYDRQQYRALKIQLEQLIRRYEARLKK